MANSNAILALAAAARARNETLKAAENADLVAPLQARIVELEGLLADTVKSGDELARALEESQKRVEELTLALDAEQKHVETLQSQLAVFERQAKGAKAPANKKGK